MCVLIMGTNNVLSLDRDFSTKASVVHILILTLNQMTVCYVKGVICKDEPTESDHQTLLFL